MMVLANASIGTDIVPLNVTTGDGDVVIQLGVPPEAGMDLPLVLKKHVCAVSYNENTWVLVAGAPKPSWVWQCDVDPPPPRVCRSNKEREVEQKASC